MLKQYSPGKGVRFNVGIATLRGRFRDSIGSGSNLIVYYPGWTRIVGVDAETPDHRVTVGRLPFICLGVGDDCDIDRVIVDGGIASVHGNDAESPPLTALQGIRSHAQRVLQKVGSEHGRPAQRVSLRSGRAGRQARRALCQQPGLRTRLDVHAGVHGVAGDFNLLVDFVDENAFQFAITAFGVNRSCDHIVDYAGALARLHVDAPGTSIAPRYGP